MLARKAGPKRKPGEAATVLLFRHLVLCSISTWILNFLVAEGLEVAVELFIEGTNPHIEAPEVPGNYVPPWAWLTAVSSGFVSVLLHVSAV